MAKNEVSASTGGAAGQEARVNDGKTPDTPESLALWVWDKFVGCPITEPYDAMYLLLLERLKFMHRTQFTAGLRECLRQVQESRANQEAVASRSTPAAQTPFFDQLAIDVARETYDRFVMGGWSPADMHAELIGMFVQWWESLAATGETPRKEVMPNGHDQTSSDLAGDAHPQKHAPSERTLDEERAPEEIAQKFHETYERLAPQFGYETRKESAKPWSDVPDNNKRLMIAVCAEVQAWLAARGKETGK